MTNILGPNDKISGTVSGWSVPFQTSFVAHLNGEAGFNSTVGIMTDHALLKISIDQDIRSGETYAIGATDTDHKVRLEFDDTRAGNQGTYFASRGEFTVLQLQDGVLTAKFHFEAETRSRRVQQMSFSSGAFTVENFKHVRAASSS